MKTLSAVLILLTAICGEAKNLPVTKIIQPLDNTRYIGENSTFIIDTSYERVDKIVIRQDNNTDHTIDINTTRKTYCKTIKLHPAQNIIAVDAFKNGKLVSSTKRDLFFLSELFEGVDEDEAENYELRYLHTDKKEQKCKSCHNMKSNVPTNGEAFEDITQTTCYECHKGMINTRNTHAPTANWLCLDCHNGKFGEYNMDSEGKSKYLAPDPISRTCATCHKDVPEWQVNKYSHGPVNDGRCERCHNPHGSNNEFFLRKSIWDLCTTCHAEKADGKHVVSSFVFGRNQGAHPTKNRRDPSRPSRELTCSSCHNPHGSSGVFLLRMKGSMSFNVCRRCHKK